VGGRHRDGFQSADLLNERESGWLLQRWQRWQVFLIDGISIWQSLTLSSKLRQTL
jgi:hypothetical protein